MRLEKIFEPLTINHLTLANRLVVSAMVTGYANADGTASERLIAYHEAKARGGWGLIIPEDYRVAEDAGASQALPGLYTDEQIASHQALTRRVHAAGSKILCQLYHAGSRASSRVNGVRPVAPSAVPYQAGSEVPRALRTEEIAALVEAFGDCALRAKRAGFDGVEIHGAHGYLVSAFVSPYANKRGDDYGGTLENRARFALEIVRNIRQKVGKDFTIFYRMSAVEYVDGGLTIEEAKVLAMLLEDAGVDAIHCSQGGYDPGAGIVIPPSAVPKAAFVANAAAIKSVVRIPVIAVGRINDPLLAEAILRANQADLVTMARASLADPDLPRKAREGRLDEIRRCIGCVQGCKAADRGCLVNPLTGHEREYDLSAKALSKRVYIAGGGVSGCAAAITAAQKGHQVTLFESDERLGGQWNEAAVPIGKAEFASFLTWQSQEMKRLGVQVCLGMTLDQEQIEADRPEVVIIATGSQPLCPPIDGIGQDNVCFAQEVLRGSASVGQSVVVIGGGLVGAETADYLAQQGHRVTIVEIEEALMRDAEPAPAYYLRQRLQKNDVTVHTLAKVLSIKEDRVTMVKGAAENVINGVDTIVIAAGARSYQPLLAELNDYPGIVLTVGDAQAVKNGLHNIRQGYLAGLEI